MLCPAGTTAIIGQTVHSLKKLFLVPTVRGLSGAADNTVNADTDVAAGRVASGCAGDERSVVTGAVLSRFDFTSDEFLFSEIALGPSCPGVEGDRPENMNQPATVKTTIAARPTPSQVVARFATGALATYGAAV